MITSVLLKELRADINEALAAVGEKHNVRISAKGATYDPDGANGSFKLEVLSIGASGDVHDKAATSFVERCRLYGLKPEDLGRTFKNGGLTFTVSGLKPLARSMPILATDSASGKTYKFTAESVKALLAAQPVTP